MVIKKQMLEFFKKPYPFNNDLIHNAKIIFFISVVLGGFLFFFEPFNFNEFNLKEKLTVSSVISLITFAGLSFNMIVMPSYLRNIFSVKKWNVFKEILWNMWLIIFTAAGYFLYFRFNFVFEIKPYDIVKIVLISFFAVSVLVVLNQNRLVKLNLNDALELNRKLISEFNSEEDELFFESENKKDSIKLTVKSIISVKSAGNYVEIYYLEKGKTKKHLIRNTLKNIEDLLNNYDFIFRCHRTFLINTKFIEKAEGDSQGINLFLKNLDFKVPVSRTYINKLKEIL